MELPRTNGISLSSAKVDHFVTSRALGSMWFENAALRLVLVIFNALRFIASSFSHANGRFCNRRVVIKILICSYGFTTADKRKRNNTTKETHALDFGLGVATTVGSALLVSVDSGFL